MIPHNATEQLDDPGVALELRRDACRWLWLEYATRVAGRVDEPRCRWICVHPAAGWRPVTHRDCDTCQRWEPRQTP